MVDQVGRRLGHAPGPARRAKATALAAEGDQLAVPAVTAAQPQEAVGQDAAFEKGVELVPHKLRQVGASRGLSLLEEGGGVLLHQAVQLEDGEEMREIFIDEAREVIQGADEALQRLAETPDDLGDLTLIRRAFHTLKGSARMVGLKAFGHAAWSCEQLYNARLADFAALENDLAAFTGDALRELGGWVEAIAIGQARGLDGAALAAQADALRQRQVAMALPALLERVPGLPSAADLQLDLGMPQPAEAPAAAGLFELRLDLDEPAAERTAPLISLQLPPDAGPGLVLDLDAPPQAEPFVDTRIDLSLLDAPETGSEPQRIAEPLPLDLQVAPPPLDDEQVKVIGDLRIGIPLFNIYLNEADELSRRLCIQLAEWAMEDDRPLGEGTAALAHSLAGSSATVGYVQLSALARLLEHALMRSIAAGRATPGEPQLFIDAAEEIRRLLHQFAAGFLRLVPAPLLQRLEAHELAAGSPAAAALPGPVLREPLLAEATAEPVSDALADDWPVELPSEPGATEPPAEPDAAPAPVFSVELGQAALTAFADRPSDAPRVKARADALDDDEDIDAEDLVDEELFPIFREEGEELLPQLQSRMRDWARRPSEVSAAAACMRTLHTFKGGARLAGAMRLGEMAHRLETAIEHLLARGHAGVADVEALLARVDAISSSFELLGSPPDDSLVTALPEPDQVPLAEPLPSAEAPAESPAESPDEAAPAAGLSAQASEAPRAAPLNQLPLLPIDWSRFKAGPSAALPVVERAPSSMAAVRVRAPLLDRLVNQAGEVSITRARIESDVGQIKGSLVDLTDNLERLRRQLRDLELQAESQISSRMEAAKASAQGFDPLEMDRFTRFQELTRMMAESVNDVATVQRGLQRSLQSTEDELAAQARLTRDLQDDLLRTRMVEFEGMADRLYRVVRQAAKETGKQVRLDIVGGAIEVDRGVLDRMTGPFEHLLRNCVTHGIESPEARVRAGKDATGSIAITVTQEGNEVGVEFRDDGAGLNLARIRERALALGLLAADVPASDAELAQLIFSAGFSTAESVSELSGRGVGMDVVRTEVNAMGGRIETATAADVGASFRLVLPLTTAVTQVVMLRCGELRIAVPSTLVEVVRRVPIDELEQAYASGSYMLAERVLPFFWLGALLQSGQRGSSGGRSQPVLVIRSASQRVALHVDEVLGNQEVVVKNLGPQLSRLPGLAGITLLASGAVTLIYNPVALAALYGDAARHATLAALRLPGALAAMPADAAPAVPLAPLVMVVDDSLTVRRVTQRLLLREGYRVVLAKDGLDALERLAEGVPAIVLSDIEMPRMDGFDLVRNIRADARLRDLPVIMITSRIAQKHREYAAELGVDHYLGKPYAEEDLLALIGRYTQVRELRSAVS